MTYRQSETYSHKMPQKLTATAYFIQEESSGGKTHHLKIPLGSLPPEDSSWMKQAVVVSFEAFYDYIYMYIYIYIYSHKMPQNLRTLREK